MAISDEDRKQIVDSVLTALDERRRADAKASQPPEMETKLYLVTLSGHLIAVPDERGKAIHHQCVYARIEMEKGKDASFYGGINNLEIIAFGDGEPLAKPVQARLTGAGVTALVIVADDFLQRPRK